jgi:hypothetical protein
VDARHSPGMTVLYAGLCFSVMPGLVPGIHDFSHDQPPQSLIDRVRLPSTSTRFRRKIKDMRR